MRSAALGRYLVLALAFFGLPTVAPAQTGTTGVRGVVRSGERAVEGAEVGVVDGPGRAVADHEGRYQLLGIPPGEVRVFVRAVGFLPQSRAFVVPAGTIIEHDFTLQKAAVSLPELRVEAALAKPARLAHTTRYDDFYRRRRSGLGTFLTREQIDESTALRTFELLRGLPGIQVTWNPPGVAGTQVRFARCSTFPPKIGIWIDGVKQPSAHQTEGGRAATMPGSRRDGDMTKELELVSEVWREWLERLDAVSPRMIEAVEIFRGVAQIPAEFLDDSCAAIVIWTREGGKASR